MSNNANNTKHATAHIGSWMYDTSVSMEPFEGGAGANNVDYAEVVLESHPDVEAIGMKSSAKILDEHKSGPDAYDLEICSGVDVKVEEETESMYVEASSSVKSA